MPVSLKVLLGQAAELARPAAPALLAGLLGGHWLPSGLAAQAAAQVQEAAGALEQRLRDHSPAGRLLGGLRGAWNQPGAHHLSAAAGL